MSDERSNIFSNIDLSGGCNLKGSSYSMVACVNSPGDTISQLPKTVLPNSWVVRVPDRSSITGEPSIFTKSSSSDKAISVVRSLSGEGAWKPDALTSTDPSGTYTRINS